MHNSFTKDTFQTICDELASADKVLSGIIAAHGYPPMWLRANTYETLVHIILEQQVSLASALAALKKLQEHTKGIAPKSILGMSDEDLRACYVCRQKAVYIRHLATAIESKQIELEKLATLPDDEVRAILIALKGIGNWTTDVYLMFVLQSADIFPIGDLAAVNSMKRAYNLPRDTPREELSKFTERWQPYRTVATMILWHHYLSAPIKRGK
ncbi:MAG: DNA-3-methyladenine glycosylase 2 family protein [Sphingobacteriales bacterium]|nr:MAG: DNA-3-methyladenine glycosylase 2 family protein [Sphingobacteriales bacterium]